MPISTINSYLKVMQQFAQHWTQVNARGPHLAVRSGEGDEGDEERGAAPGAPFVLPDGYSLQQLQADQQTLATLITTATAQGGTASNASQAYKVLRLKVRGHLQMLRDWVLFSLPGSSYARAFPKLPRDSKNDKKLFAALDIGLQLWTQIRNDPTLPDASRFFNLRDGTTIVGYGSEISQLRALQSSSTSTGKTAGVSRAQRDAMLLPIRARLVAYRMGIPAMLGPTDPLTKSLPKVYGSKSATPGAVTLTANYDAATKTATFAWTASSDPKVARYRVRICVGAKWKEANVRANVNVAVNTLTWSTSDLAAGGTYCVKVYAVLNNGQARGSLPVALSIPAAKSATLSLSDLLAHPFPTDNHAGELVGVNGHANGHANGHI